jgi:hypothetical protein
VALSAGMLVDALVSLERDASPLEIHAKLSERYPTETISRATVRAQLQHYCFTSPIYQKGADLFVNPLYGVWGLKAGVAHANTESGENQAEIDWGSEGGKSLRTHLVRERRGPLIREFKKRLSHYRCEICDFDFEGKYGILGSKFIEAHHTLPIKSGERKAQIKGLRAVCSNCHRMLHRLYYERPQSTGEAIWASFAAIVACNSARQT